MNLPDAGTEWNKNQRTYVFKFSSLICPKGYRLLLIQSSAVTYYV